MKLTYRPEIDGLRAIAVGAVILYHAQITILGYQPFKGGFIGVDIFFVISGYLITSIILKELATTGIFSFKRFYERRTRRILPALLFVMLVSLPFAWMYLLPSSFSDFSKSILYSLGFSSNFYFHYSGQVYGALDGLFIPFLHTWSLSVEEQYYILFPIVLLITFKYLRKYLIHILILGFVISLCLADWGSRNYPSFNFYILPTRIWELLTGSILAYFEITKGHRSKYQALNLVLPSIGLFLIGHSILFFNDKMFHPSFYTLSPIIGVCLIIWFSYKDELITKILSSKLFVGIGLISYSLYLWHYPIFAFGRAVEIFSKDVLIYLLIITITLSIFTYYFIERPARNKNNKFQTIAIIIILLVFGLLVSNSKIIFQNGYQKRMPKILDIYKDQVLRDDNFTRCGSDVECYFNKSSNKKIFIIGDSLMGNLIYDLKDKVVNLNYQFITFIKNGCLYFPGFTMLNSARCTSDYFKKLENILLKESNSIFILGGKFNFYLLNNQNFISDKNFSSNVLMSFRESVLKLSKKNKIIIIYPIPESEHNIPKKLLNSIPKEFLLIKEYLQIKNYITIPFQDFKGKSEKSFELLNSIKGNNIYRVYPHKAFCNTIIKDQCLTHDDKYIFYRDNTHLSPKGAEMVNNLILEEIKKIKLQSK